MKANIGKTDRLIRIAAGSLIIIGGIGYRSWLGAIGLVPMITGMMNYCPLYRLVGISTRTKENEKKSPSPE